MDLTFKYGDLKKIIAESSNEFKAKIGPNVESEDKKNNGKAYDEAKKRAKEFDGGLNKEVGEEKAEYKKVDGNKTTLDYNIENASDDYKERVHAQVDGYTSKMEKDNGIEKAGDFSDNEKIYQELKRSGKAQHADDVAFKKSGLQASKWPEKVFKKGEMYESKEGVDMRNLIEKFKANENVVSENKKTKVVSFKKTKFINEEHMTTLIPDDLKNEGEKFKMRDKSGNTYLLEWKNNKANVLSNLNEEKVKSDFEKFKVLSEYKTPENKTDHAIREGGEETFVDMLNKLRDLK